MSALESSLKARWLEVCKVLEVEMVDEALVNRWWQVIKVRYSGKGRAYHTLEHLGEIFEYYDQHSSKFSDTTAVILAIFFHDVVYDPQLGSPKNEKESAVLFERFGQEAIPAGDPPGRAKGELMLKVSRWIVQTAHHRCAPGDELDCKLLMDFDMAVLGKPWEAYEEYTQKIRREYIHVPEPVFWTARKSFLEATANGPAIFATDTFRESHEAQAKANVAREAKVLGEKLETLTPSARLMVAVGMRCKAASKVVPYIKRLRVLRKRPKFLIPALVILALLIMYRRLIAYVVLLGVFLGALLGLCYFLKFLLLSPFVSYPYPEPGSRKGVVVIAGSYNPPHLGHLAMIEHLAKTHTSVHVVIGVNPSKTYEVNAYERQELLKAMVKELDVKGVRVVVWSGIIFEYARSVGAQRMYRGIRSWQQDGRAEKYLEFQNIFYQMLAGNTKPIPTAYLQANPELAGISSTVLRERIVQGKDISDIVPKSCAEAVALSYRPQEAAAKTAEEKKAE
uniref:Cytidyltransferase-like domain-containing protein n=1 Tax=Alexandrium monilatum TaxID=311494 RepID=A0A7S4VSM3_9DINO|mmetsp:Transcript_92989/g.277567  ORF Transcript_92989/g.277567 Transcript_92989/m.277567 type:complete len:508 (-) Transcript_92989:81-1604(-)